MSNKKTDIANSIFYNTELMFIITTLLMVGGGIAMIIIGAINKEEVITTTSWPSYSYTKEVSAPLYGLIVGGVFTILLSPFIWLAKPFFDGFGILVCRAAVELKEKNVQTYLDEKEEKPDEYKPNE